MASKARAHLAFALAGLICLVPGPASALEATIFVASPYPRDDWRTSVGIEVTLGLFKFFAVQGEMVRQGTTIDTNMTSVTGSAFLVAPLRRFKAYGGVGVGAFRQGQGALLDSDYGLQRVAVLGLKRTFEDILVVKVEYRRFNLSGDPLLPMEHRIAVGAGVSF